MIHVELNHSIPKPLVESGQVSQRDIHTDTQVCGATCYCGFRSQTVSPGTTPFEPLLSTDEAAQLLRMHPKTLQAMARAGQVPCAKIGKQWLFRASLLDEWVNGQLNWQQSRRVSTEEVS